MRPRCAHHSAAQGAASTSQPSLVARPRLRQHRSRAACPAATPQPLPGTPVADGWRADDYVDIGVLGRPHGVTGEMVVRVETSTPEERLGTGGVRYIQPPPTAGLVRRAAQAPHEVTLTRGRAHVTKGHTVWLVRLKEVTTREAALALRNHRLMIRADAREALADEDEFYAQDLVGLEVILSHEGHERDGMVLGRVTDLFDGTGTYDSLEVAFTRGLALRARDGMLVHVDDIAAEAEFSDKYVAQREASGMLPFRKEFVPEVDVADGCIEICPPEGWLELYLEPVVKDRAPRPPARRRKRRKDVLTRGAPEAAAAGPEDVVIGGGPEAAAAGREGGASAGAA